MGLKLSVICCFGAIGASAAVAQSGPAELPPDDFAGRQYIDSDGCIYLRKTSDNGDVWEPRTLSEGEVMCGFAPTFPVPEPKEGLAGQEQAVIAPKASVDSKVRPETVTPKVEVEPVVAPKPVAEIPKTKPLPMPSQKPVAAPEMPKADVATQAKEMAAPVEPNEETSAKAVTAQPEPEQRAAPAETAMAQPAPVESGDTPSAKSEQAPEAVTVVPKPATPTAQPATPRPETPSQPAETESIAEVDWSKGTYLQIAAFRQRENTLKTKAVIEEIGLQVAIETVPSHGRPLEVVLVGPFAEGESAKAALRAVRKAGYKDAFTRKD